MVPAIRVVTFLVALLIAGRLLAEPGAPPRATVALTGQPVPGLGGVSYGATMSTPILNRNGQIVFDTALAGAVTVGVNDSAVLRIGAASTDVLRAGGSLAGIEGTLTSVRAANVNGAGTAVVRGTLSGPGITSPRDSVLMLWNGGASPQLVARGGDAPPGATGNEFWSGFGDVAINESARLAIQADLGYPSGGRNDRPTSGIWAGAPEPLAPVVRDTDPAPGIPGVQWRNPFSSTSFDFVPVISAAGDVVFAADLYGNISPNPSTSVWSHGGAGSRLLVRQGSAAPGFGNGGTINAIGCSGVYLNDAGHYALNAGVRLPAPQVGGGAIWLGTSDGIQLLARRGQAAPTGTPGHTFLSFDSCPSISGSDLIGFSALIAGPGVTEQNDSAKFIASTGSVRMIAREGDPAPDLPAGVRLGRLNYYIDTPINARGDSVFIAELAGAGVHDNNDIALFVAPSDGAMQLLAREGPGFEIRPGDVRSVRNIALTFGNTEGGYAGAINDLGHVTFGLEFTDGTSGIFLVTVPEPSAAGVLCCVFAAFVRRGRCTRGRA